MSFSSAGLCLDSEGTETLASCKITREVRADFETWYHFLSEYNGHSFFLLNAVHR